MRIRCLQHVHGPARGDVKLPRFHISDEADSGVCRKTFCLCGINSGGEIGVNRCNRSTIERARLVVIKTTVVLLTLVGLLRLGWLDWATFRFRVPVYALILLALLWAGSLWLAFNLKITKPNEDLGGTPPASPSGPPWLSYISDNIFGVDWIWGYDGRMLSDHNIAAICPRTACQCRLGQEPIWVGGLYDPRVALVCQHCDFRKDFDCDWGPLVHRVLTEVERRIRTREYLKPRLGQS